MGDRRSIYHCHYCHAKGQRWISKYPLSYAIPYTTNLSHICCDLFVTMFYRFLRINSCAYAWKCIMEIIVNISIMKDDTATKLSGKQEHIKCYPFVHKSKNHQNCENGGFSLSGSHVFAHFKQSFKSCLQSINPAIKKFKHMPQILFSAGKCKTDYTRNFRFLGSGNRNIIQKRTAVTSWYIYCSYYSWQKDMYVLEGSYTDHEKSNLLPKVRIIKLQWLNALAVRNHLMVCTHSQVL